MKQKIKTNGSDTEYRGPPPCQDNPVLAMNTERLATWTCIQRFNRATQLSYHPNVAVAICFLTHGKQKVAAVLSGRTEDRQLSPAGPAKVKHVSSFINSGDRV